MTAAGSDILVVEDDLATREALSLYLSIDGYAVATAANGREALDRLRAGPRPRLILLDLVMPVMDGPTFRAEQRRDPALADVPVLIVSGDGAAEQKAAALGAVGHVRKPFMMDELVDEVRRYCG